MKYWLAGRTKRYHTEPLVGEQNVADHSWGVIKILLDLWPDSSRDVMMAALDHDLMEHFLGDMPAPTKWKFPDLAKQLHEVEEQLEKEHGVHHILSPVEFKRLKAADRLEAMLFAAYQIKLGNGFCRDVWNRLTSHMEGFLESMEPEDANKVRKFIVELHSTGI